MRDRTGEIYGTLQVVSFDEEETTTRTIRYGKKTNCWKCKCIKCGYEVTKPLSELIHNKKVGNSGCRQCMHVDLTGQRTGRLTVLYLDEEMTKKKKRQYWVCQCDCGNIVTIIETALTSTRDYRPPTQSCGCLQKEMTSKAHLGLGAWGGASSNPQTERLYKIWDGMHRRCYDSTNKRYNRYGDRGIIICDEWVNDFNAFKEWAYANGYQDDLTIDRIDYNGNYEPSNCRWATIKEQCNNKEGNVWITYNNETHTISEWSDITGIPYKRLYYRLRISNNYTLEEAFTKA